MYDLLCATAGFIAERYNLFLIFLEVINLIAFILFAIDKYNAIHGKWRIPEATLLLSSFLGGAFGAFIAMQVLRHKTQHMKFILLVPLTLIFYIAAAVAVVILSR